MLCLLLFNTFINHLLLKLLNPVTHTLANFDQLEVFGQLQFEFGQLNFLFWRADTGYTPFAELLQELVHYKETGLFLHHPPPNLEASE